MAAKKEAELKAKKEKEAAYLTARDKAISLQGEFQSLQAKTTAMDVAAAKARAAAKELRVAMGGGSDVEADMAADELGIKSGDAEKIANAKAGGNSTNSTKTSSGISVVNFAVPTTEDADNLIAHLFK